jgi:glutaconyl-CoA/methylmalonyl-CoA decarboxylase subunit gamma
MNDDFKDLYVDGTTYQTTLTRKFGMRDPNPKLKDPKVVHAFIPGLIKAVYVKEGDVVRRGDKLLVLEAMKMENQLLAAIAGRVKAVHVETGKVVVKNELLVEIE